MAAGSVSLPMTRRVSLEEADDLLTDIKCVPYGKGVRVVLWILPEKKDSTFYSKHQKELIEKVGSVANVILARVGCVSELKDVLDSFGGMAHYCVISGHGTPDSLLLSDKEALTIEKADEELFESFEGETIILDSCSVGSKEVYSLADKIADVSSKKVYACDRSITIFDIDVNPMFLKHDTVCPIAFDASCSRVFTSGCESTRYLWANELNDKEVEALLEESPHDEYIAEKVVIELVRRKRFDRVMQLRKRFPAEIPPRILSALFEVLPFEDVLSFIKTLIEKNEFPLKSLDRVLKQFEILEQHEQLKQFVLSIECETMFAQAFEIVLKRPTPKNAVKIAEAKLRDPKTSPTMAYTLVKKLLMQDFSTEAHGLALRIEKPQVQLRIACLFNRLLYTDLSRSLVRDVRRQAKTLHAFHEEVQKLLDTTLLNAQEMVILIALRDHVIRPVRLTRRPRGRAGGLGSPFAIPTRK